MPINKKAKIAQQKMDRQTQEDELNTPPRERETGKFFPGPHVFEDFPLSETLPSANRDQKFREAIGRFCTAFSILHSEKTLGEMQRNAVRGRR